MVLLIVVASLPWRARQERAPIDLSRISYGFYDWELEGAERRVRWTGRRATFFVRPNVRQVGIPVRALLVDPDWVFAVEVRLDGRLAQRIELADDAWHDVRLSIPARDTPQLSKV